MPTVPRSPSRRRRGEADVARSMFSGAGHSLPNGCSGGDTSAPASSTELLRREADRADLGGSAWLIAGIVLLFTRASWSSMLDLALHRHRHRSPERSQHDFGHGSVAVVVAWGVMMIGLAVTQFEGLPAARRGPRCARAAPRCKRPDADADGVRHADDRAARHAGRRHVDKYAGAGCGRRVDLDFHRLGNCCRVHHELERVVQFMNAFRFDPRRSWPHDSIGTEQTTRPVPRVRGEP